MPAFRFAVAILASVPLAMATTLPSISTSTILVWPWPKFAVATVMVPVPVAGLGYTFRLGRALAISLLAVMPEGTNTIVKRPEPELAGFDVVLKATEAVVFRSVTVPKKLSRR